ncbi:MAG: hypothetical protein RI564_01530 [Gracilimonas sp.]|nr:hypothetical protein [Gracilimonas sp.]
MLIGIKEQNHQKEARLLTCIQQGAVLAAFLLTIVFLTLGESNTDSQQWMILPYIFVPTLGGIGGMIFYLLHVFFDRSGFQRILGLMFRVMIYVFLFALAFIIGMNGPN